MELEEMHTNVDAKWVRGEGKLQAANNILEISGR
jgi:hypothetical protein